jgi:hypothetical protein
MRLLKLIAPFNLKMIERYKKMIRKAGGILSLISVALLFFIALFTYRDIGNEKVGLNLTQVIINILIGILFLTIISLYFRWQSTIKKYIPNLLIVLGIIIQIILVIRLEMPFMTDVGYVFTQAERLAANNQNWLHYFYIYPNNVNVTMLWSAFFKLFNILGISNHVLAAKLLQLLLLDISIYYLSKSLKNSFPNLDKWLMVGMIFYLPFTMMALFLYSDIFALVIFNLLIACMAKVLRPGRSLKENWGWFVLTASILGIGVALRSNLGIVGIAVGLTILVAKEFNWKEKGTFLAIIIAGLVLISFLFTNIAAQNNFVQKPQEVTPSVRYVNMSWNPNTNGEIDGTDAWAWSYLPKNERSKKLTAELKDRISNYSILGLGKHIVKKLSFMYATALTHQDFFNLYEHGHLPIWKSIQVFSRIIFQPIYVLLLFSSMITLFKLIRSPKQTESLILLLGISFLGTVMFHGLLWEVRDRYAIITLPAIIILGMIGLHEISAWTLKINSPVKKRGWIVCGIILGVIGIYVATLTAFPATPRETIMSKGYFMYAGGDEKNGRFFKLTKDSTYKVNIHLNHSAKTFNYSLGWIDANTAKKVHVKLVEKSVNKSYKGTSNLNFNAIKSDFKPGTYEFIVTTGKINPTESYLFADVETSAFHTETVKKNNQILKGVIPFFQFIN